MIHVCVQSMLSRGRHVKGHVMLVRGYNLLLVV